MTFPVLALLLAATSAHAGVVQVDPGPQAAAAYKPRRVAVLVGIQEYQDPALQGLRFAAKDAADLGVALKDPDIGGFDRVFVIAGQAATSRASVLNALDVAAADLQRDDTFLVYLSGHGTLTLDAAHGSRLWVLPSDGRLEDPTTTGLAVADLEERIHRLPARRRVLILDTCHNGRNGSKSGVSGTTQQLLSGFRGEPPAPRDLREVSESEARLYAAQYWQPALEDPALQNGVYTHYLLEGLRDGRLDADLDGDGLIDVAEAHQYARDRTISRTGGMQVPRAEYRIVGREDIFLSGRSELRARAERALLAACDMILARARLLVNGIPRGELPGVYAVEPGLQTVEIQSPEGKTLARRRVDLDAGQTLSVDAMLSREPSTLAALGGVAVVGGTAHVVPVNPSFELVWTPGRRTGAWFRPDLHVGFDASSGEIDGSTALTGAGYGGFTAGFGAGRWWVGPYADLRVPFRNAEHDGEYATQSGVSGAGGLAAGVHVPVGRVALEARAEGFGSVLPYDGGWEPMWGATLRVGVSTGL